MGRASDQHVMKKLMRKYFKFDLKRSNFNTASSFYPTLLNTWAKKGMDSAEANLVQQKIDIAMQNDENEFREVKRMTKQLPYQLNQMLPKIKTKYAFKGRDREMTSTYNETTQRKLDEMYDQYKLK